MTHNRSMHDARDPWRASMRASRERRAAARRAQRWTFRRRGVALCAAAVPAAEQVGAVAAGHDREDEQQDWSAAQHSGDPARGRRREAS